MKKSIKMVLIITLAVVMCFGHMISAYAVEESFTIEGSGNVTVNMSGTPVFAAATHSGTISLGNDIVFSGSNEDIYISDETGTNSGWKFSIAITDFYAEGIDDPTDSGAETMDVYIAAGDWLSFDIDNSSDGISSDGTHTLIPGTGGDGEIISADNVLYLGGGLPIGTPNISKTATDTLNLVTVNPGYGAGKYYFDLNYTITIDEWLPEGSRIDSSAANGERFDELSIGAAEKVQVFAGIYTTNITYSASCNPAS